NYMVFGAKDQVLLPFLELYNITKVTTFKYLGLYLDSDMKWTSHINHITNKLHQCSFILRTAKKLTYNKSVLNSLYYAFGYSHLVYMPHIWSYSLQRNLNQLQIAQNRCLRIIYNANWFHSNITIFNELKMLTVNQITTKMALIFIYKLLH